MGRLYLHINTDRKNFVEDILARSTGFIQRGDFDAFMIIVPTSRWAESIRQQLLARQGKCLAAPLIFGFNHAIDFLYSRLIDSPKAEISKVESLRFIYSLLKKLISEISEKNSLLANIPLAKVAEEFVAAIEKISDAGYTPEQLIDALGVNMSKPADVKTYILCRLFQEYQEQLAEAGLINLPEKISAISKTLLREPQKLAQVFPRLSFFAFFGFDLFSENLYLLIQAIAEKIAETHILLEYDKTRPYVFEHLAEPGKRLSGIASEISVKAELMGETAAERVSYLFFREPEKIECAKQVEEPFVGLIIGKNPQEEIDKICRWIKYLLLTNPAIPREKICLCFPQLEEYLSIIRRTFSRYGIPIYVSLDESFSKRLFSQTIKALINVVASNYERRSVIKFLQSPYVASAPLVDSQNILALDKGLLGEVANIHRIVEGKKSWFNALEREVSELQSLASRTDDELDTAEVDVEFPVITPQKARLRIMRIAELKEKLGAIFEKISLLEQEQSVGDFIRCLQKIIAELQLENLAVKYWERQLSQKDTGEYEAETIFRELSAVKEFSRLLSLLKETQRFFAADLHLNILEFSQLLTAAFDAILLPNKLKKIDAVQVLGKLDLRGLEFDYIIFGGLTDSTFPKLMRPSAILNEEQRKKLHLIPPSELVLSEDLFLFYNYLRQAKKQFICSYPKSQNDKILLPSIVVEELKRIAKVEEINLPEETEFYSSAGTQKKIGSFLQRKLTQEELNAQLNDIESICAELFDHNFSRQMKKTLRMTIAREQSPRFTEYEGVLTDPAIRNELQHYTEKVFSVSQLEEYGRCPFAFFCSRILGIEPLAEFEEEISPLDRGRVIHKILYRFYREWQEEGKIPVDTNEKAAAALIDLRSIAEEELSKLRYRGTFWEIEKENILGKKDAGIPGLIDSFVEKERRRFNNPATAKFHPQYFEISFGRPPGSTGTDEISSPEPFVIELDGGEIKLRGRIDRIDADEGHFVIFDYKTSASLPGLKDLEHGLSLQLPIYTLAAENLINKKTGKASEFIGSLYYKVRDQEHCELENFLSKIDYKNTINTLSGREQRAGFMTEIELFLKMAREYIADYVSKIRSGFFVVRDIELYHRCKNCSFNRICRADFPQIRAIKG